MNFRIIYNVFMRDFRKQKKRMTLTILAIAWGTISIMLLLAFGEGLKQQMSRNQKGLGEGIAVVWGGQTSIPYKGMGRGRPIRLTADDIEYLRVRMPELKNIAGEYLNWGIDMRFKDKVCSELVCGLYPCYEDIRTHYPQAGGRFVNETDMSEKRRVVFLGNKLKEKLFGTEEAVGKIMLINSIPFTVIGVMQEKMQMGMYHGPDDMSACIPATTFSAIFGYRYLSNMIYQPYDISDMKGIENRAIALLAAKYKYDPKDEQALQVWDVASGARELNNILLGIQIFLGIIGGMSLLIAGVGVANIMYVSIKERTREIGIKMAIGARKKYILSQFLLEAVTITAVGGFFGMSLSYILTETFKSIKIQSDVLSFMGKPTVSPEIGLIVILILGMLGLISGIFPAMRAASVNPVESLRYE